MIWSWLTPLGFLGLLGIAVLVLIYVIKPNFQQKFVSSTFIWKLSLKFRKKKVPINKFRNILLFLCQLLIIAACALILAQPILGAETEALSSNDSIMIIDASASMRAMPQYGGETRFDRAVEKVKQHTLEVFEKGGRVTVIVAGAEYEVLERANIASGDTDARKYLTEALDEARCTDGSADIDGMIGYVESVLQGNINTEVLFYTGTNYLNVGKRGNGDPLVEVVDMRDFDQMGNATEWNAAILDVKAELIENEYVFNVSLASYDKNETIHLYIDVIDPNVYDVNSTEEKDKAVPITRMEYKSGTYPNGIQCGVDARGKAVVTTVAVRFSEILTNDQWKEGDVLTSFSEVCFSIDVQDSIVEDNQFWVYNGRTDPIKIQVWSSDQNSFFYYAFSVLTDRLRDTYDITFTRTQSEPALEGFDLYIFEHGLPSNVEAKGLPTDGVVVLCDPTDLAGKDDTASVEKLGVDISFSRGGGIMFDTSGGWAPFETTLGVAHSIMNFIRPEDVKVMAYKKIETYDSYTPVLMADDGNGSADPLILVRDSAEYEQQKIVIMPFSLNYSTLAIEKEFMILLYNTIDYFFPVLTDRYVYDVNESMTIRAKSTEVKIAHGGEVDPKNEFPLSYTLSSSGTYTLTQTLLSGNDEVKKVFVKSPAEESNIFRDVQNLTELEAAPVMKPDDIDLLVWFAAALVVLLFVEWWLQSRENF